MHIKCLACCLCKKTLHEFPCSRIAATDGLVPTIIACGQSIAAHPLSSVGLAGRLGTHPAELDPNLRQEGKQILIAYLGMLQGS